MKTMNETLKANHLMVGDYVKWEYVSYPDVVVNNGYKKVDAIYGDESVDLIDEDTLYEHVPMDEIKVVELTTEILEKNGFEVQDQGGGRKDVWIGFGIDCEGDIEVEFQHNIPTHLKIDGVFKGEYYISTNIKYVHELQHALRLCGVEKEIIL